MKKATYMRLSLFILILTLGACSSGESLQEYYVSNSDNPNFISLDVPASILNLDSVDLTNQQRQGLQSLKKLNILAFKKNEGNAEAFETEKARVQAILKNEDFMELMKLNSSYGKGVVKYLGDDNVIEEVIIYGSSDDKGFALIRVLGDKMNPAHMMQLLQQIQQSDSNGEEFRQLGDFIKG